MINHHNPLISVARHTERLKLRPPGVGDLPFLTALFAKPEMVAHRPTPQPDSADECAARLKKDMAHWQEHGFGRWAVIANGNLIGFGGLTVSKEFDGLNLSYHLDPQSWGNGYATELVRELLSFAFKELKARRIIGLVRSANPASRKVLEKCGLSFECEVMLHGAPTNLYTITR
ncbi:GNAT family N-acetyltransferase [Martelella alba]|uniref:GNAT family N-acetyltransferase n=1 Tax=Martelella alba TaxID=2590451 RepID=A0A506U8N4_9HYPH|nr:GNAT family N-acetyltransferase [Martelella alba]TPW29696.1 GNAT family N-acetyltransferase [Martelella alba]